MRFYSFFVRFWVNYRVFWGGCLSFWGIIFFIIVHIKYFAAVKITLHITVRTYGWYKLKYTLILSY